MTDPNLTRTEKALIAAELKKHGEAAGVIDVRDLELVADRVRIDPSGFIYGAEKAVQELKVERPHIFKPSAPAKRGAKVVEAPASAAKTGASSDMTAEETARANKASKYWRDALAGS